MNEEKREVVNAAENVARPYQTGMDEVIVLSPGTFVRVREDHTEWFRAGRDGMVIEDLGESVGLFFGYDRHCELQNCICMGTELWKKTELDLETAC